MNQKEEMKLAKEKYFEQLPPPNRSNTSKDTSTSRKAFEKKINFWSLKEEEAIPEIEEKKLTKDENTRVKYLKNRRKMLDLHELFEL